MAKVKNIPHSKAVKIINAYKVIYNYYLNKRKTLGNIINTSCAFLLAEYSTYEYKTLRSKIYYSELNNIVSNLNYYAACIAEYKRIVKYHNKRYVRK